MTIRVPDEYNEILIGSKNYVGCMGLSVGKVEFMNLKIMDEYASFFQEHFLHSIWIIGDYPKKYNIKVLEGVSEREAERRARVAGDDLRNALEKVTREYPFVKTARWKHFMTPHYTHNLEVLIKADKSNSQFQEECNEQTLSFLSLPANTAKLQTRGVSIEHAVKQCKNYLLDELALLTALPMIFTIPVCEVYPGKNNVQEKLQRREFDFCAGLHLKDNRVFMEAHYER